MIRIDVEGELQKIIQQLDRLPDQIAAPNILKNALNATARKVRKQLVNTNLLKDTARTWRSGNTKRI